MDLLADLEFRGQLYQQTNAEGLREHLGSSRKVYCGFDPTRDSLTIGNLVPIMLLRRFQQAGHTPVVITGGGTGMIGDPSGKEAERTIMTPEQVAQNVAGQRVIFERLLDFDGPNAAVILNNADWLSKLGFIEALRDIGKHFSVNMMIQKDSVRERLNNRDQGISYTEFSYMLLQAYDFAYLMEHHGVTVQASGSDQWGNVVAGVDLIRRTQKREAFGLTVPLITKADGGKFGKTETGAVWLTAERTSPYAFYQFWLNAADADVPKFLRTFTFFSHEEIVRLEAEHQANPGARTAHRALAQHLTELLHGAEGLAQAQKATEALFSGNVSDLSAATIEELFATAPSTSLAKEKLTGDGYLAVDLLVDGGVVKSKRESREFLGNGAILMNGRTAGADDRVRADWLLHEAVLLIRRGKRNWHVVRFQ
ncbi:MAG TPA: tyrosine--tRNA ligase [Polyangiaceae bacterium]|jgi:tyrosyl-tRNA synthetase|nr:tyrosine--tRNA ligase [Polyangiaceae bacterium]